MTLSLTASIFPHQGIDQPGRLMSTVEKLEQDVAGPSPEELARFRAWLAAFDAAAWDRRIDA
jgi:hypothetical protein